MKRSALKSFAEGAFSFRLFPERKRRVVVLADPSQDEVKLAADWEKVGRDLGRLIEATDLGLPSITHLDAEDTLDVYRKILERINEIQEEYSRNESRVIRSAIGRIERAKTSGSQEATCVHS